MRQQNYFQKYHIWDVSRKLILFKDISGQRSVYKIKLHVNQEERYSIQQGAAKGRQGKTYIDSAPASQHFL